MKKNFDFFLMIGLEFLSLVGSIRKSIKTIFKNNFSSYRGSFVINKNANIEIWKKNEFCMSTITGVKLI